MRRSPLFRDGQKPPQQSLEIIVAYMAKAHRPVYLGLISLEVRWSLARTQEMMELLQQQGIVREATPDEKRELRAVPDANVWCLV